MLVKRECAVVFETRLKNKEEETVSKKKLSFKEPQQPQLQPCLVGKTRY